MNNKIKIFSHEIESFEKIESDLTKELAWGAVLILGGFLIVFTLLFTNNNLESSNALDILYFGCSAGMILTVFGAWGLGCFISASGNC